MAPVPRIQRIPTPMPSTPNTNTNRSVSFQELMPPPPPPATSILSTPQSQLMPFSPIPPPPVAGRQRQLVPMSNVSAIEIEILDLRPPPPPRVQSMTLNVEHPGTYAVTLDFNPCPSPGCNPNPPQQNQQNDLGQVRDLYNHLNYCNGGW